MEASGVNSWGVFSGIIFYYDKYDFGLLPALMLKNKNGEHVFSSQYSLGAGNSLASIRPELYHIGSMMIHMLMYTAHLLSNDRKTGNATIETHHAITILYHFFGQYVLIEYI